MMTLVVTSDFRPVAAAWLSAPQTEHTDTYFTVPLQTDGPPLSPSKMQGINKLAHSPFVCRSLVSRSECLSAVKGQ